MPSAVGGITFVSIRANRCVMRVKKILEEKN